MWKLIIILVLVIYLLNKISVILFRASGRSPQQPNFRRRADGNINVDGMAKKSGRRGGLKGGEYVDYEEVK